MSFYNTRKWVQRLNGLAARWLDVGLSQILGARPYGFSETRRVSQEFGTHPLNVATLCRKDAVAKRTGKEE
jgi:hypothetical protein